MKMLHVLLFLSVLLLGQKIHADEGDIKEISLDDDEYSFEVFEENALIKENNQRRIDLYNLQKAKFKIISGDFKTAMFLLNRIDDQNLNLVKIKKRYQAIIHFINGQFYESLKILKDPKLKSEIYYPQTCVLRLLNYMTLNDYEGIEKEKRICMFYTEKYSRNDQFWLDAMLKVKNNDKNAIRVKVLNNPEKFLTDDEMARLWLKTGLYLNKEEDILKLLGALSESNYESKRLRELIAFMYLRRGDHKKALTFIDDVDSANSENIKGTINLMNKEYELAFGHFRLALQKKQDSANSLERAIPLAWLLNQWDDGLSMLNNISNKNLDPRSKDAVRIAFLIRKREFLLAQKELTLLKIAFYNQPPFEVNIMDTYVNLILGNQESRFDKRKVEESAEKSCKAFDGISCWISLQYVEWENLGKTITRNEAIVDNKEAFISELKVKKEVTPLKESVSIDQADIEELDGETIKINPQ